MELNRKIEKQESNVNNDLKLKEKVEKINSQIFELTENNTANIEDIKAAENKVIDIIYNLTNEEQRELTKLMFNKNYLDNFYGNKGYNGFEFTDVYIDTYMDYLKIKPEEIIDIIFDSDENLDISPIIYINKYNGNKRELFDYIVNKSIEKGKVKQLLKYLEDYISHNDIDERTIFYDNQHKELIASKLEEALKKESENEKIEEILGKTKNI